MLILVFGPLTGAHFDPAVTLAFRLRGEIRRAAAAAEVAVQILGGLAGTWAAHLMVEEPLIELSTTMRSGFARWSAEFIAAVGLVATILGCQKARPEAVAYAVGLYITAGYWCTASTSFANPAVTIARSLTDTFSGIRPIDAPAFIVARLLGAAVATLLFRWLLAPEDPQRG